MDQMSDAPSRPGFSLRMISGAMYMGVPASEFMTAGASTAVVLCLAALVRAMVLLPLTMTLAAPKSTSLSTEFVASRMSWKISTNSDVYE